MIIDFALVAPRRKGSRCAAEGCIMCYDACCIAGALFYYNLSHFFPPSLELRQYLGLVIQLLRTCRQVWQDRGMSTLVLFCFVLFTALADVASRACGVSQSQVGPCAPLLRPLEGANLGYCSLAICGLLSWSASTVLHSQDGEERQKRRLSHNLGRGVEMICSTN